MRSALLSGLAALLLPATAAAGDHAALVAQLRAGGLVVFLRHAETGPAHPDTANAVIGACETQRNLNEAGRAQAVALGDAFRALSIPVGTVLASPFCRTMETAVLAFGDATPHEGLALPRHLDPAAHARLGEALRALLPATPPRGGNLLLVGHSYHLIAAGGPRLEPQGAAAVLRPEGGGRFTLLGEIPPAAWTRLAQPQLTERQ